MLSERELVQIGKKTVKRETGSLEPHGEKERIPHFVIQECV